MSTSKAQNPHALTAVEKQRAQLDRLLKDPVKPAFVPAAPKDKTLRPAREMMKNVQGSSAGAGSGEFHVYKASRRREYERLKMLEDESTKEVATAAFERKRKDAEDAAEEKTAKNRAKRQKKKDRAKKGPVAQVEVDGKGRERDTGPDMPIKKRRLVNGKEVVFKRPGEDSDEEPEEKLLADNEHMEEEEENEVEPQILAEEAKIIIHEDD